MGTRPIDASGFERELIADMSLYGEKISGDEAYNRALLLLASAPTLIPSNEPERAGLYGKYTVYKNKDGSLVTDCFILRPAKDLAAVAALRAYAATTDNAELSADILNWVGAEPNKPLTIEQLREMDGEPVWVEEMEHWALIDIEKSGQWAGIPFAVWAENGANFIYNIEDRKLHCFHHLPKRQEVTK